MKSTTITLQLADRSLTYPPGIVEDVLVKVDKFTFPADFVILDMEEDQDAPLIFGRPFLATDRALNDVHKRELTLRVGGETIIFNIYNVIRRSDEVSICKSIDIIDFCVTHVGIRYIVNDLLERCMARNIFRVEDDIGTFKFALESLPKQNEDCAQKGELTEEHREDTSNKTPKLKVLPCHLCYV